MRGVGNSSLAGWCDHSGGAVLDSQADQPDVATDGRWPSATGPVGEWLTRASVGMEGVLFKRLDSVYEPAARGWRKYKNAMNCS